MSQEQRNQNNSANTDSQEQRNQNNSANTDSQEQDVNNNEEQEKDEATQQAASSSPAGVGDLLYHTTAGTVQLINKKLKKAGDRAVSLKERHHEKALADFQNHFNSLQNNVESYRQKRANLKKKYESIFNDISPEFKKLDGNPNFVNPSDKLKKAKEMHYENLMKINPSNAESFQNKIKKYESDLRTLDSTENKIFGDVRQFDQYGKSLTGNPIFEEKMASGEIKPYGPDGINTHMEELHKIIEDDIFNPDKSLKSFEDKKRNDDKENKFEEIKKQISEAFESFKESIDNFINNLKSIFSRK
jgi:hypothetical protein